MIYSINNDFVIGWTQDAKFILIIHSITCIVTDWIAISSPD